MVVLRNANHLMALHFVNMIVTMWAFNASFAELIIELKMSIHDESSQGFERKVLRVVYGSLPIGNGLQRNNTSMI